MPDPIRDHQFATNPFRRPRPRYEEGTEIVYKTRFGTLEAPKTPFTSSEWRSRRPTEYWRVDTRNHVASFSQEVRSASQTLDFRVFVEYKWVVVDCREVVLNELHDVPAHCVKFLRRKMNDITRSHRPEHPRDAQEALMDALDGPPLDAGTGIKIFGIDIKLTAPAAIAGKLAAHETGAITEEVDIAEQRRKDAVEDAKQEGVLAREVKRIEQLNQLLIEGRHDAFVIALFERSARAQETIDALLQIKDVRHRHVLEEIELVNQGAFGAGDEEEMKAALLRKLQDSDSLGGGGRSVGSDKALGALRRMGKPELPSKGD